MFIDLFGGAKVDSPFIIRVQVGAVNADRETTENKQGHADEFYRREVKRYVAEDNRDRKAHYHTVDDKSGSVEHIVTVGVDCFDYNAHDHSPEAVANGHPAHQENVEVFSKVFILYAFLVNVT